MASRRIRSLYQMLIQLINKSSTPLFCFNSLVTTAFLVRTARGHAPFALVTWLVRAWNPMATARALLVTRVTGVWIAVRLSDSDRAVRKSAIALVKNFVIRSMACAWTFRVESSLCLLTTAWRNLLIGWDGETLNVGWRNWWMLTMKQIFRLRDR